MKLDELNDWLRQLMWIVVALYSFISMFLTSYIEFGWIGAVFSVLQIVGILTVVWVASLVLTMSCWEWHAIKNV